MPDGPVARRHHVEVPWLQAQAFKQEIDSEPKNFLEFDDVNVNSNRKGVTLDEMLNQEQQSDDTLLICVKCHEKFKKFQIALISSEIKKAFTELGTEHRRIKHFESTKYYIEPVAEVIGTQRISKKVGDKVILHLKEKKAYIIPLDLTLKIFLEIPGVFDVIYNYQKSLMQEKAKNSSILRNIVQGSLWDDLSKKFDKNQIVLPLLIFFDDFETGNPLASHAGKNKIGAVYSTIATIPPNMSSRVENTFLSYLFYSDDRTTYGNKAIFKKFILSLKSLEENGINICINNQQLNIKFVLVAITGDNLGLHSILGFFESFNATNFCRFCLINKADSQNQLSINPELIRSIEEYDKHVKNKINVKESCVWHDLPNFHVYQNLSCDVMHDLMEGIHRYSMPLIIHHLIEKQYFTLDELNSRIKYFLYHNLEVSPAFINNNHLKNKYLIMSASEMLSLVRNFCFIIGDKVEEKDDIWHYYLILLELTTLLTSQTLTYELVDYLEALIIEHNETFISLFNENLKPKHHLLLHYPTIIKKIGPPILYSSFKGETKHSEMKKVSDSIHCYKQLPLSISIRCQLKCCFRYTCKNGLDNVISFSKNIQLHHTNGNEYSVDWYQINGVRYNKGMVIVKDFDETEEPILFLIEDILINKKNDEDVTFECISLKVINFNAHFNAYNVDKTIEKESIAIDKCLSQPLMLRNICDELLLICLL
ncbi:uncharacterized protein LOC123267985 [Cotesia glomerata]|uniref:uncharacterized protein LOC123267985 n=1 Tax=Cotesia glomerata TaxID=32391 RepID=UPI001D0092DA|nr:uncharacterized protein LOC123267985 [Cotesia glomerata]